MRLEDVQKVFRRQNGRVYLDTASHGLVADDVLEQVHRVMNDYCAGRIGTVDMFGYLEKAREELARLISCDPGQIALVQNTTEGMNVVASGFGLQEGDEVLLPDVEFFGVALPWAYQAQRTGARVRLVHASSGQLDPDTLTKNLTPRTKVVVLSSVQECTGVRVHLPSIAEVCRPRDILLVADTIQEVGAMAVDAATCGADVIVCGGHKWLMAPFGMGFVYFAPGVAGRFDVQRFGYMNVPEPACGWESYLERPDKTPLDDLGALEDARRFESGGFPNLAGAVCLAASVGLLNRVGIGEVESYILENTGWLSDRLREMGFILVSGAAADHRSGIVVFRHPSGYEETRDLARRIRCAGIELSLRASSGMGGIRVSFHLYNTREDIETLVQVLSESLRGGGR